MPIDEKTVIETPAGNKVWCKDDIIHYLISAPVDESEASSLNEGGLKFVEEGTASRVLIDLKKSTQFSSEARKVWVKFLQNPQIKKTAIFGGNVFVRTLASFVIAASQNKNIKFFTTEEDAREWLSAVDQ